MKRFLPLAFAAVVSPFLLGAGCGGDISFHGTGGGQETAQYTCKGPGELSVTWRGERGTLTVQVYDPAAEPGTAQFSRTFVPTGTDQTFKQSFSVPSKWDVTVSRTAEWKGAYTVRFTCT